MVSDTDLHKDTPRWMLWTGRVLAVPIALLVFSGAIKILRQPAVIEAMVHKFGYAESTAVPLGVIELLSVVLYFIPRTAPLGAILVTGYLGGAIATHVRIGEPFIGPFALGVLAWVSLFLRNARVRALFERSHRATH